MYLFRLIVLFFVLSFPSFAYAEDQSIAVVDVKRVMSESEAAQSIQKQSEKLRAQYLSEISDKEQSLRALEKQLVQDAKNLSEEARLNKRQDYEKQLLEARNFAQTKKRGLEKATQEANRVLQENLYKASQEISEQEGYDLIISNQNVITGKAELDVTASIIEKLNALLPDVVLKVEAQ